MQFIKYLIQARSSGQYFQEDRKGDEGEVFTADLSKAFLFNREEAIIKCTDLDCIVEVRCRIGSLPPPPPLNIQEPDLEFNRKLRDSSSATRDFTPSPEKEESRPGSKMLAIIFDSDDIGKEASIDFLKKLL